ncbi:hypothetical protein DVS77_15215 [Mycolicibacterium moriokaense]|nr:hypothetical protein DVS77_15215 [Mycolicibacterium moriokaense]
MVAIPLMGAAVVAATGVFSTRLASILSGEDFSFYARYPGPFIVAQLTVDQYPIFGVGVGAKEALWEQMQTAFARFYPSLNTLYDEYLGYFNNALANSVMFFGIVGAVAFYYLIAQWAKGFGVGTAVALSVVLLFFMLDGALEGIRMWSSIAIVWGCFMLASGANPTFAAMNASAQPRSPD